MLCTGKQCGQRLLVGLAALALAGYSPAGEVSALPEEKIREVTIKNLQFVPESITVEAGTTIVWINKDPVDHDVTSGTAVTGRQTRDMEKTKFPDGRFHSQLFGQGEQFSVTLEEKGEYAYYCDAHPFMLGSIMVK